MSELSWVLGCSTAKLVARTGGVVPSKEGAGNWGPTPREQRKRRTLLRKMVIRKENGTEGEQSGARGQAHGLGMGDSKSPPKIESET